MIDETLWKMFFGETEDTKPKLYVETAFFKRPSPEHLRDRAEIYVNNGVTVMKVGNNVYKATPEKGERFDVEKGILVCIAKYCGFSTTDILELVEKANIQKTKKTVKSKKKKK